MSLQIPRVARALLLGLALVTPLPGAAWSEDPSSSQHPTHSALVLPWADSADLDAAVATALRQRRALIVTVGGAFSRDEIPAAIEIWLYRIRAAGGSVQAALLPPPTKITVRAGPRQEDFLVSPLGLDPSLQAELAAYDALLFHDRTGKIERIELRPREPPSP